jgi:uncharacterized damage-inducible protein DinB
MSDLRYPIGPFKMERDPLGPEERAAFIQQIADAPGKLRDAVRGLAPEQIETPYRPGGWTVRQVAHHLPDSHMNGYVRFKLALTEDEPTVKPYQEALWATLEDSRTTPIEVSLRLLDALHERWVRLLRSLSPADFARGFHHPDMGPVSLDRCLAIYGWHGRHHVAHITALRDRMGWE